VSIHVPNQIIGTFVLNLQQIYAQLRLKPPFARNYEIRLFIFQKSWNSYTYERIAMLNMCYKLDLLQPKQEVFWHFTYSRSETCKAWKISLEVMKFVYLHATYVLSVLIIGLNITCTKFCTLWIFTRPTSHLYTLWTQNMTRAKWWNTCIASQHLGTFIKAVRDEEIPVRKVYGYDTLQPR